MWADRHSLPWSEGRAREGNTRVQRLVALLTLACGSFFFVIGCNRDAILNIHYLPAFVAGTQKILPPLPIAVLPAAGSLAYGKHSVGAIYDPDGSIAKRLFAKD